MQAVYEPSSREQRHPQAALPMPGNRITIRTGESSLLYQLFTRLQGRERMPSLGHHRWGNRSCTRGAERDLQLARQSPQGIRPLDPGRRSTTGRMRKNEEEGQSCETCTAAYGLNSPPALWR
jgi:hypothetical protein